MALPIRVVLADAQEIERNGVRTLLATSGDCQVVGEEADGFKVLNVVAETRPDVLLLDLTIGGIAGPDLVRQVTRACPQTRILLFGLHAEERQIRAAVRRGAVGYVLKEAPSSELLRAIRYVAGAPGRYYFSPALADRVFAAYAREVPAGGEDPVAALTPRERAVLQLVLADHSSPVIAARLGISPRTVESHRAKLMRKLGVRGKADLLRYALRTGLLPPA